MQTLAVTIRFWKALAWLVNRHDSRIGADPRWIFDARLDYKTPSGNIALGVWIRNLTDEFYPITAYDRKKGISSIVYVVSEPRTYGVSLSYLF